MKNWKNILAAMAFVFAVGGAYATSLLIPVTGYEKILSPFRIGVSPTECLARKTCKTENNGVICTFNGVQLFGDDGTGKCLRVVYEQQP